MVRLSVAIQSHPRRAAQASDLAARLSPLPVEIVNDPDPNARLASPWRTYQLALDSTPDWATHRLVIQDDATPCEGFAEAAPLAVAARPNACIAFFHGGRPRDNLHKIDAALRARQPLVRLSIQKWVPVIALSWPREIICPCLCWTYEQDWPEAFRADDEIVGHALRAHGVEVWATVPSLVEHEDVLPSLIGRKAWAGRDRARVAYRWLAPPEDAREIAWS